MAYEQYKLIGKTPEWGISASEEDSVGIIAQSLDYEWQADKDEFQDHQGNTCGARFRNQRLSVSLSGAKLLGSDSVTVRGGDVLTLANAIPDLWIGGEPTATTCVVESVKHSHSNTAAVTVDLTATIYPFAA